MIPFRFLFTNLVMALRTLNYASYEAKNLRNVVLIKFLISIYMIIEYGIIGAAISAVVCEVILFLMCYYSVKKLIFYN
jgi:O-antigen/teichoic acid export membrane protein